MSILKIMTSFFFFKLVCLVYMYVNDEVKDEIPGRLTNDKIRECYIYASNNLVPSFKTDIDIPEEAALTGKS